MDHTWENLMEKGFRKVERMEQTLPSFPHITQCGDWLTHENGHWTGGFWVGLLWLKSLGSLDPETDQRKASHWAKKLKVRINDNKTHDQGFIFGPSCILGHHLTGDEELKSLAAAGAKNMKDLYEDRVGLILAWDEPGYDGVAIVDTIMNLPLLVWVAEQRNQPDYREMACHIADHIFKHHVRPDYSTYHVVRWDTYSYDIVERRTHQGFASESCWSRGQAWATYGFANMYRYTKRPHYLETAIHLAEYFWSHLDDEMRLPRWDFVFKNHAEEPLDAAAASIAASGMLLLADLLERNGSPDAFLWLERGQQLVQQLTMHCFYRDMDKYGIIEKATVDKPRNSGVGESTMYGDYYFMEALYRLQNQKNNDKRALNILY